MTTIISRKLNSRDVDFACELHAAGIEWIYIAEGLGVTARTLRKAVDARLANRLPDPAPPGRRQYITTTNQRAADKLRQG